MRWIGLTAFAAVMGFAGVYGFARPQNIAAAVASNGCLIKGNVSFNTGERIYHVPGQHYYNDTIITPAKGERWFCSEAEAIAAGWRRAGY